MQHRLKSKQEWNQLGKGSRKAQTGISLLKKWMGKAEHSPRATCSSALQLLHFTSPSWWLFWVSLALILLHSRGWRRQSVFFGITESLRLEKPFKVINSNHQPSTTTFSTNPHPQVPHPQISWTFPGVVTPPLPWTWFQWFTAPSLFLISNVNLPWHKLGGCFLLSAGKRDQTSPGRTCPLPKHPNNQQMLWGCSGGLRQEEFLMWYLRTPQGTNHSQRTASEQSSLCSLPKDTNQSRMF